MQKGDVIATHADSSKIINWTNFAPKTDFKNGIRLFAEWFLNFYNDKYLK